MYCSKHQQPKNRRLLGSDDKNWEYESIDAGNIKKKQLFIISKIRELLEAESVKEEAELDLEHIKKEYASSIETIKKKDSIIQELKEGIRNGNILLDSIDTTNKQVLTTYTEKISKENEDIKIRVNELEDLNKSQSDEIKRMISKLENMPISNTNSSESNEINRIIGTLQNAYVYMNNPSSEYKDKIIINLLRGISSKGDRKSTRLNSSHSRASRMPSSA